MEFTFCLDIFVPQLLGAGSKDPKKNGPGSKSGPAVGGFFPPIWKICSSQWAHLPQVGVKIKNNK